MQETREEIQKRQQMQQTQQVQQMQNEIAREYMYPEDDEATIDLMDLLAAVLHRWKFAVSLGLLLMILVGGVMSFRDYQGIQNKYQDETATSLRQDMTETQIRTVEQFFQRYRNYQQSIVDNEFYIDNSYRMSLDPNHVSRYTKEYLVNSDYAAVMSSFGGATLDHADYELMAAFLGEDVDARYVYELVSISGGTEQDAYEIDTDKVGDVINGSIANRYTGILTLSTTTNSREQCEQLAGVAEEAIYRHLEELQAAGIQVELSELDVTYTERVDSELAEYQRSTINNNADQITAYYKFEEDAKKSMDEAEQALFTYMIEKEQVVTDHVHWKKWCVIGLGVGVLLALVIIVLQYLLNPGIKTADDLYRVTGERELGIIREPANSKIFLGKTFHRWAGMLERHGKQEVADTEAEAIVCERIAMLCREKEIQKLYLITDVSEGYPGAVTEECRRRLTEKGLAVTSGNPMAALAELQELRASAGAVFVFTKGRSLADTAQDNQKICRENRVSVIGNIFVQPQR